MAAAAGVFVTGDAAPADEALVRKSGAAEVVARGDDVASRIRALHPDGVDAAVDAALIGPQILDAVRDGGSLALVRGGRAVIRPDGRQDGRRQVGDRRRARELRRRAR